MKGIIGKILKDNELRTTQCREEVLQLFFNHDFALSNGFIEREINHTHDRVTVYRTLKTFLDKGIIHKVLDVDGGTKYALCKESCTHNHHQHEHVHFTCLKCSTTTCLDALDIPGIKLPSGYTFVEANFLIQGICNHCNN
jgi:Fur family transcriptional regulator, ferric uptake regulator